MNMSVLNASCRDADCIEMVAGVIGEPFPCDCVASGVMLLADVIGEPCPFACAVIWRNIALVKRLPSPFSALSARA